jgi:hypothetical protein
MEYEPIRARNGWDPDLDENDKQDPGPHQGDADPQHCSKTKLLSPFLHLLLALALQL